MRIAIIYSSDDGKNIADIIQRELSADIISRADISQHWSQYKAFFFVGAMGICVRTIAPLVADKHTDPAVVCVDSQGRHVISVLSGHVGGANDLTGEIARILGATPIVTTQSDATGLWALDTLAQRFGWSLASQDIDMNSCVFKFVNRRPTALLMDIHDEGTEYLEQHLPAHVTVITDISAADPSKYELLIIVSHRVITPPDGIQTLQFVPRIATVGIGLAHQAQPAEEILAQIMRVFAANGLHPCAKEFCTIDVKADEPVVGLLRSKGETVRFFTSSQLAAVEVPNPSQTVEGHVGTPSVCEAAAILGSDHGRLICEKTKGSNYTVAVAISRQYLRGEGGHIEIVGAGPGDPDLVSVRGRKLLERADLILYAGSLVPKELTFCAKPGATVRSSASMDLEAQCQLMKEFYDQGKLIVRLHTGDPCIFGAIQEQMAFFDEHQMSYHITPGISSFLAAAAELRSQFTIPERCQTIILTRGEGRTPMPEREKLHLLARSQSTMCIFLSASIVDDVQQELLQEYPENTPVAVCYHLTWRDQRIWRGQLKELAHIVHTNHLTLTTMIVVGEAIDNRKGLSELYSKHFTHLFRKGQDS